MWPANEFPESKVHGANMGPAWDQQDPGGPHVGPMNLDIWVQEVKSGIGFQIHYISRYMPHDRFPVSTAFTTRVYR